MIKSVRYLFLSSSSFPYLFRIFGTIFSPLSHSPIHAHVQRMWMIKIHATIQKIICIIWPIAQFHWRATGKRRTHTHTKWWAKENFSHTPIITINTNLKHSLFGYKWVVTFTCRFIIAFVSKWTNNTRMRWANWNVFRLNVRIDDEHIVLFVSSWEWAMKVFLFQKNTRENKIFYFAWAMRWRKKTERKEYDTTITDWSRLWRRIFPYAFVFMLVWTRIEMYHIKK